MKKLNKLQKRTIIFLILAFVAGIAAFWSIFFIKPKIESVIIILLIYFIVAFILIMVSFLNSLRLLKKKDTRIFGVVTLVISCVLLLKTVSGIFIALFVRMFFP